jgi:ABC-type multidrug transport system fused ATPase/permease subunit
MGGSYMVNGEPASSYDRASWCRHFAFVPQDVRLIRGTIAENIMFDRAGLSYDAVQDAIAKAQLSEEIGQLPDGLATQIGIGVRSMSGGQEQRLGIARAFVTSPSVIVLDEPTSSLDPSREKSLIDELARLHEDTTVIIVTHRPTSLTACDRIIEMREGRIAVSTPAAG